MRLCARCVFVVQSRAVVILTNGGYGDLFAMLAAGQLREIAPRSSSLTLKNTRTLAAAKLSLEFFLDC